MPSQYLRAGNIVINLNAAESVELFEYKSKDRPDLISRGVVIVWHGGRREEITGDEGALLATAFNIPQGEAWEGNDLAANIAPTKTKKEK